MSEATPLPCFHWHITGRPLPLYLCVCVCVCARVHVRWHSERVGTETHTYKSSMVYLWVSLFSKSYVVSCIHVLVSCLQIKNPKSIHYPRNVTSPHYMSIIVHVQKKHNQTCVRTPRIIRISTEFYQRYDIIRSTATTPNMHPF